MRSSFQGRIPDTDGEALRNDNDYAFVSVWEYKGDDKKHSFIRNNSGLRRWK
jgi:hypothetical protein